MFSAIPTSPAPPCAGRLRMTATPPRPAARLGHLLVLSTLLLLPPRPAAAAEPAPENPSHVKAAFLRNFAHYVTWPANTFNDPRTPWRIGVLGNAPFADLLENTLRGHTEQGRAFEVHRADTLGKLPPCQIVYLSYNDPERRHDTLEALRGKPILTVGDAPEHLAQGGIIRLHVAERVHIGINLDCARASSLTIQTKLLEVSAEVLENGKTRKMR